MLLSIAVLLGATFPRTHAIMVDLPVLPEPGTIGPLTPSYDLLTLEAAGALRWNGLEIDRSQLRSILHQLPRNGVPTELRFDPAGDVAYGEVFAILGDLYIAGRIDGCFRFPDLERYRRYEDPSSFAQPTLQTYTPCDPPAG